MDYFIKCINVLIKTCFLKENQSMSQVQYERQRKRQWKIENKKYPNTFYRWVYFAVGFIFFFYLFSFVSRVYHQLILLKDIFHVDREKYFFSVCVKHSICFCCCCSETFTKCIDNNKKNDIHSSYIFSSAFLLTFLRLNSISFLSWIEIRIILDKIVDEFFFVQADFKEISLSFGNAIWHIYFCYIFFDKSFWDYGKFLALNSLVIFLFMSFTWNTKVVFVRGVYNTMIQQSLGTVMEVGYVNRFLICVQLLSGLSQIFYDNNWKLKSSHRKKLAWSFVIHDNGYATLLFCFLSLKIDRFCRSQFVLSYLALVIKIENSPIKSK